MARHARRTTVTPLDGRTGIGLGRWRVDFATFDRPTNPSVVVTRRAAFDLAWRFELSKARARFIEEQAAPRRRPQDRLAQLARGVGSLAAALGPFPQAVEAAARHEQEQARKRIEGVG